MYNFLYSSNYSYLNGLGLNWKKSPIISFTFNCNDNNTNFIDDIWEGTKEGCYCPFTLDILNDNLREGFCKKRRDNTNLCRNVYPIGETKFKIWRGNEICIQTLNKNYFELNIVAKNENCNLNSKPCGVIDSLNNILCVDLEDNCPINYIKFDNSSHKNNQINLNGKNLTFFNNYTKGKIPIQFKISDKDPCALPYYKNTNGKLYKLEKLIERSNCNRGIDNYLYDINYIELDTVQKKDLYIENGIEKFTKPLPEFKIDDYDVETKLYYKPYIGINPSCRNQFRNKTEYEKLIEEMDEIEDNIESTLVYAIINMLFHGISCLLIIYYIIATIKKEKKISKKVYISFCPTIFSIIVFISSIVLINQIKGCTDYYMLLNHGDCLDKLTYQAVSTFSFKITFVQFMNYALVLFSFLSIVLPITSIIFEIRTSRWDRMRLSTYINS